MTTQPDPRALQLAEAHYRNSPVTLGAWDTLGDDLRQTLIDAAATWLHAAIEAGIAPAAERPTDNHEAVYLDDEGYLYAEYRTVPPSDSLVRLVWASEQAESKAALEDVGAKFRLLGWST